MSKNTNQDQQGVKEEIKKDTCGLVMPISETDGYPKGHWAAVKSILDEVIESAGFISNLVSDADDVGIIHNRIVKNLAENTIVICDVSSKNPNVMFELGLRLAFDKATIIIKDELTSYSFDTSPIEHVPYPSDLNYHSINDFKVKLSAKLLKTVEASKDPSYSTFLKNFVIYKRQLQTQELDNMDFITKQFDLLNRRLERFEPKVPKLTTFSPQRITHLNSTIVADLFSLFLRENDLTFESYQNLYPSRRLLLIIKFLRKHPVTDSFSEQMLTSFAKDLIDATYNYHAIEDANFQIQNSDWSYRFEN